MFVAPLSILVVDDEPQVCEVLKLYLEFDGHAVDIARNGNLGLEKVRQKDYDLVFTDYCMPSMRGDQFARSLKDLKPETPVVMVTAHAEAIRSGGMPGGVDFLVAKPFSLQQLQDAVRSVLPARVQPLLGGP